MQDYKRYLFHFFDGKLPRLPFFLRWLVCFVISLFLNAFFSLLEISSIHWHPGSAGWTISLVFGVSIAISIGVTFYALAISARRLADIGKNRWLTLVLLVPLIGFGLLLYLFFAKGSAQTVEKAHCSLSVGTQIGYAAASFVGIAFILTLLFQNYFESQMPRHWTPDTPVAQTWQKAVQKQPTHLTSKNFTVDEAERYFRETVANSNFEDALRLVGTSSPAKNDLLRQYMREVIGDPLFARSFAEAVHNYHDRIYDTDPKKMQQKSIAFGLQLGQSMAANGFRRLDPQDMLVIGNMQLLLLKTSSPTTCKQFVLGNLSPAQQLALSRQYYEHASLSEMRRFLKVSQKALRLGMIGIDPKPMTVAEIAQAENTFGFVAENYVHGKTQAETERLLQAIIHSDKAPAIDVCRGFTMLYTGILAQKGQERDNTLRYIYTSP